MTENVLLRTRRSSHMETTAAQNTVPNDPFSQNTLYRRDEPPDLLTLREVATYLRKSRGAVRLTTE